MTIISDKQREIARINNERVLRRMRNKNDRLYLEAATGPGFVTYPKIVKDAKAIKTLYGVDVDTEVKLVPEPGENQ